MRPRLPTAAELAASALEHGALIRQRGIRDAETLLRLALSYGACGLSLRGAAMWAEAAELASVSNVALLNRLRGCAPWLATIAGHMLSSRVSGPAVAVAAAAASHRVRLVDATTLSAPGSGGADWRVHVAYDLVAQRTTAIALSDGRGAESLCNFEWAPGDLAIGDRGYAKARDLAAVAQGGADFIVRTGWNAFRLRARDGAPFDLFASLDRVPELGDAAFEIAVALNRADTQWLPARLVVWRKSAADAEASRDGVRARPCSRRRSRRRAISC